jgi:hypothetical protein
MRMSAFELRVLSSLTKVFPDEALEAAEVKRGSALRGEIFSFQAAYRAEQLTKSIRVKVNSDLGDRITVRTVGLVPSELPTYHDHDDRILRAAPGLYPDPLMPLNADGVDAPPGQWRSVWITVDLQENAKPGWHDIEIVFTKPDGDELGRTSFALEVIPAVLPEQRLIFTEWFHTDCLAAHYRVDVFSEEHWALIERFAAEAAAHGMNMILTPLFTPPLDTAVGGERPTVQLVDVEKSGEAYRFRFDKLERWVRMCRDNGIRYFEFSHLFTQWGAKHAPKIVAEVDGERKKIFGWETDASGEAYRSFLDQFLPELVRFIRRHGLEDCSYFHVSDEPSLDQIKEYEAAAAILQRHLADFPIIDALSDYAFYEKGLVKNPIPANNHIEPFLENGVPNLWTYYCCVQYKEVSNRFFNMPSTRNRILGMQLYKFKIAGFLHWGYNFWFTQLSKRLIDPFRVTDAGRAFPSGDAFLVYPGEDGRPISSIRFEVLREALQDLRALQWLERHDGRERTLELLEEGLTEPLTFSQYPLETEWMLAVRQRVNDRIKELASIGSGVDGTC